MGTMIVVVMSHMYNGMCLVMLSWQCGAHDGCDVAIYTHVQIDLMSPHV